MKKSVFQICIATIALAVLAITGGGGCSLDLSDEDNRYVKNGYDITKLAVSGQTTSFEQGAPFSLGSNATITATFSDGSTKNLTTDDVTVNGYTTSKVGTGVAKVVLSYSSGQTIESTSYDIDVTAAVKSIEITNVEPTYVYNPGALNTALNTAFTYSITAKYSDGTSTASFDQSKCSFAYDSSTGITVTYESAVNGTLSDTFSSAEVASACTNFTVASGTSVSGGWWAGHTANMAISTGKSGIATLKYNGTGTNTFVPVLKFTNGDATILDGVQTDGSNYAEYAVFQGCTLYGWKGDNNTANKGTEWADVTETWGTNGAPENDVLINGNIPYTILVKNNGTTFDFSISLTGTDNKEYTGTVKNIPGGADLNLGFCCDQDVTLTFD